MVVFFSARLWAADTIDPALHLLRPISLFQLGSGIGKGIASDGTNYLVALQSSTSNQLIAQFLGPTGMPIGSGTNIGTSGSPPLVSFDGSNYLLVWADAAGGGSDSSDIHGRFISPQGSLVGSAFGIASGTMATDVGGVQFDGTNYLVVWEANTRSTNLLPSIQGQFVDPSGNLQGSLIQITSDPQIQKLPCLAFDGANYLVVWASQMAGTSLWEFKGRLVSRTGVLLSPFSISQTPAGSPSQVAASCGTSNSLVVWSREDGPYVGRDSCSFGSIFYTNYWPMIYGRLVSREGCTEGSELAISHARGGQSDPAVAFDGTNFLVVWRDKRLLSSLCTNSYPRWPFVFAKELGPSVQLDEPEFTIPSLAGDGGLGLIFAGGQYIAVWQFTVVQSVALTTLREQTTFRPSLGNLVRLSKDFLECDLFGDTHHVYSIDVSTNLHNWMVGLGVWGDPVACVPGSCVMYNSLSGSDRIFCRATDGLFTCIRNLRQIKSAKDRWCLDTGATILDTPTEDDLWGSGKYLPAKPICPNGGAYTLLPVDSLPTCTRAWVAGHTL